MQLSVFERGNSRNKIIELVGIAFFQPLFFLFLSLSLGWFDSTCIRLRIKALCISMKPLCYGNSLVSLVVQVMIFEMATMVVCSLRQATQNRQKMSESCGPSQLAQQNIDSHYVEIMNICTLTTFHAILNCIVYKTIAN